MLSIDSYPPVPLSTWKGGTHSFGFSSYEGAAGALRARTKISGKLRQEFSCFSFRPPTAVSDCARGVAIQQSRIKHRTRLLHRTRADFPAGVLGSFPRWSCAKVRLTRRGGLAPPLMPPGKSPARFFAARAAAMTTHDNISKKSSKKLLTRGR